MTDVLIAGAGPAGTAAAIVLARAGLRVVLVDRAHFPRAKPCGDTLNPGALALVGFLGLRDTVEAHGVPLAGMAVTGGSGRSVVAKYPRGHALAIRREVLDNLLLEAAAAAGADVRQGVRVVGPLVEESGGARLVRGVVVDAGHGARPIVARWTVAAEGRRSPLAIQLGLNWLADWPRRWAVGGYYTDVAGCAEVGEMHVRRGYYVGVAPLGAGLVNVCAVSADRGQIARPSEFLDRVLSRDPMLRDRFARARRVSPLTCLGPLAVECSGRGVAGLALAGDAAGFVDPMTGDGMRFALGGGVMAARAIQEASEEPSIPAHVRLATARRRAFAGKLWINRLLRAALSANSGVTTGEVAAALAPVLIRRLILFAADLPGVRTQPTLS